MELTRIGTVLPARECALADERARLTRRELIKRIIASGAVASASSYVGASLAGCARAARSSAPADTFPPR
jgi:hypothetical protein